MNSSVKNRNFFVFCLLSIIFGVLIAFVVTKADTSILAMPTEETDAGKMLKLQRDTIASVKDQIANEAYEKRNIEITSFMEDGAPQISGNAALLYYQAFLLQPEPNESIKRKMYPSVEPDRQIRTYLGHCLPTIEIVEIASRMTGCIWGGMARIWT